MLRRTPECPPARPHGTPLPTLRSNHAGVDLDHQIINTAVCVNTHGAWQKTKVTLVFFNATPVTLEGALTIPLPTGMFVDSFQSLDPLTGKMVDAVIVESTQARQMFEAKVRNFEPSSMCELKRDTQDSFNMRIYPIHGCGFATVSLTYCGLSPIQVPAPPPEWTAVGASLGSLPDSLAMYLLRLLTIPDRLRLSRTTKQFSFLADAAKVALPQWLPALRVQGGSIQVDGDEPIPIPAEGISSATGYPSTKRLQEAGRKRFSVGPDGYFVVIHRDTTLSPVCMHSTHADPGPVRVAIAWDVSLSRFLVPAELNAEIDFLLAILNALPPSSTVQVYGIGMIVTTLVQMSVMTPNLPALIIESIKSISYVGGTDMGLLKDLVEGKKEATSWVFFGDGRSTVCGSYPAVPTCTPVSVVTASSVKNAAWLKHLSNGGGAVCLFLSPFTQPTQSDMVHIDAIIQPKKSFKLLDVKAQGATDLLTDTTSSGTVVVAGRLQTSTTLDIVYGQGDVKIKTAFRLQKPTKEDSLVSTEAKFWAHMMACGLALRGDEPGNRTEIASIGKIFGIVTSATSWIVPRNIEDFIRHDVEPPIGSEYFGLFTEHKNRQAQTEEAKTSSKLARVAAMLPKAITRLEPPQHCVAVPHACGSSDSDGPRSAVREGSNRGGLLYTDDDETEDEPRATRGSTRGGPQSSDSDDEPSLPTRGGKRGLSDPQCDPRSAQRQRMDEASAPSGLNISTPSSLPTGLPTSVTLTSWDSKMPYLAELARALKEDGPRDPGVVPDRVKQLLFGQSPRYNASPGYHLDVANFFGGIAKGAKNEWWHAAIDAVTSILELPEKGVTYMRQVAYFLACHGPYDIARHVFSKILLLSPHEPQSYRDLALVLWSIIEDHIKEIEAEPTSQDQATIEPLARECVDLLTKVIMGEWDARFPEIEVTALEELRCFLAHMRSQAWLHETCYKTDVIPLKWLEQAPDTDRSDLRISMGWDTDMVDIDLHVVEPSTEEAYYGNRRTRSGGVMSLDFRQGYGPEIYQNARAPSGRYLVFANYFASSRQDLAGATSITVSIWTNWGQPGKQQRQQIVTRLNSAQGGRILCAEVVLPPRV